MAGGPVLGAPPSPYALRQGFRVTVLSDAVRGIDAEEGDTDTAPEEMRRAGARLIPSDRLLGEGRL